MEIVARLSRGQLVSTKPPPLAADALVQREEGRGLERSCSPQQQRKARAHVSGHVGWDRAVTQSRAPAVGPGAARTAGACPLALTALPVHVLGLSSGPRPAAGPRAGEGLWETGFDTSEEGTLLRRSKPMLRESLVVPPGPSSPVSARGHVVHPHVLCQPCSQAALDVALRFLLKPGPQLSRVRLEMTSDEVKVK